jgi:hypothetical protein
VKEQDKNLLDMIPEMLCQWEISDEGKVNLLVPRFRNQFLHRIAIRMGKSEFVKVHLDETGTLVWKHIDGHRTVEKIGQLMKREEKETAQQAYERLCQFLIILSRHQLIHFREA